MPKLAIIGAGPKAAAIAARACALNAILHSNLCIDIYEHWPLQNFVQSPTTGELVERIFRLPRFMLEGDRRNPIPDGSWAIDATRFDTWWFASLLKQRELSSILSHLDPSIQKQLREILRHNIKPDLTLPLPFPALRLHVPMLADLNCGPHCSNLMALGLMAQQVLSTYVQGDG